MTRMFFVHWYVYWPKILKSGSSVLSFFFSDLYPPQENQTEHVGSFSNKKTTMSITVM